MDLRLVRRHVVHSLSMRENPGFPGFCGDPQPIGWSVYGVCIRWSTLTATAIPYIPNPGPLSPSTKQAFLVH